MTENTKGLIYCPGCAHAACRYFDKHPEVKQLLYRCDACGLYFAFPHTPFIFGHMNTGKKENEGFWASPEAHGAYTRWREAENIRIARLVGHAVQQGERVLEIGFGEGPLTELLLKQGVEYWGIEPDPIICQKTIARLALDNLRAVCLKAEDLASTPPFSRLKGHFKAIALISVLEHISRPAEVLRACATLLKENGSLFISVPDSTHFRKLYALRKLFGLEPWTYFHISFFNEHNLATAFAGSGLCIASKQYHPLINDLSADYFGKRSGSRAVYHAMMLASRMGIDRLIRINTIFYELRKTGA